MDNRYLINNSGSNEFKNHLYFLLEMKDQSIMLDSYVSCPDNTELKNQSVEGVNDYSAPVVN